jgi:hypothetical protein
VVDACIRRANVLDVQPQYACESAYGF